MRSIAHPVTAFCRMVVGQNPMTIKRTKYRAVPTVVDGIRFDSKKEASRWVTLKLMQMACQITELERQVKYELIPKQDGERACTYLADFRYFTKEGKRIIEDCKGMRTEVYRIKRKLLLHVHGIRITEV